MSAVDERIVSMEFDNQRFEKNVSQTMNSLEALDETVSSTVSSVNNSFLNFSDGLSRLDLIFAGFYQKIGGYLADLTLKAVEFSKSLSIDQISAGFQKYTAETLAVQTIVSNTNNSLEKTYDVLGDILAYTDQTSYHYDRMTDTVANFANQGVDLEKAAIATKGIANWAAISGAGIERADYAMSALVKSMSAGYMSLQEWNTISKVAKMGNKQFIDTLIDEGVAMGKFAEGTLTFENFRNEAFGQKHLIDSELLLHVLEMYGNEESELGKRALDAASEAKTFAEALGAVKDAVSTGFGTSFRYLFGNYDEARKFWTGVQDAMLDVFTIGIKYRNQVLEIWHNSEIGGYIDLVNALADAWEHVKQVVAPIGDAFHQVFGFNDPAEQANVLASAVTKFKTFVEKEFNFSTNAYDFLDTSNLGDSVNDFVIELAKARERASQNSIILDRINNAFKNLFQILQNGKNIISQILNGFKGMFEGIGEVKDSVISFAETLLMYGSALTSAMEHTNFFGRIIQSVSKIISSILQPAFKLVSSIIRMFTGEIDEAKNNTEGMENTLDLIAGAFEWLADVITGKAIAPIVEGVGKAFAFLQSVLAPIGSILRNAKDGIVEFFGAIVNKDEADKAEESVSRIATIGNVIVEVFKVVGNVLGQVFNFIKESFSGLDLNGILKLIKNLLVDVILVEVVSFVKNLDWIADNIWSFTRKLKGNGIGQVLLLIGTGLLELGLGIAMIASIDPERLGASVAAISWLMAELAGLTMISDKVAKTGKKNKELVSMASYITLMSSAMYILAKAVKKIGELDTEEVIRGGIAITILLGVLTGVSALLSSDKQTKMTSGAGSLVAMALAIDLLVIAIKKLGALDLATLAKGLISVILLLGSFTAMAKILDGAKIGVGTGFAVLEIAAALDILVIAVKKLGEMEFARLGQGLLGVVVILAALALAMRAMPSEGMISAGIGLLLVSTGLGLISNAVIKLSSLSVEELAKGVLSIGAALLIMAGVLRLAKSAIGGAIAIDLMVVALIPLVTVMKILSGISTEGLVKSVVSLGAALAILAGAMALSSGGLVGALALSVMSAALIPLAIALKMMSELDLLEILTSLGALFIFLGSLAGVSVIMAFIMPMLELLTTNILKLGLGIAALAAGLVLLNLIGPSIVSLVANVVTAFMGALPEIFELCEVIIIGILDLLIAAIPKLAELVETAFLAILQAIAICVPALIQTGVDVILAFVDAIMKLIPVLADLGFKMIIVLMNGIADAIRNNGDELLKAGWNLLTAIWDGFWSAMTAIGSKIIEAGKNLVEGIKKGLDEHPGIKEWIFSLPEKIKAWFIEKWEQLKGLGGQIINGIAEGLSGNAGTIFGKIGEVATGLVNRFKSALGIQSPSKVFAELGGYIDKGLASGLERYSELATDAAENLGDDTFNAMRDSLSGVTGVDYGFDDPVIRPVLDLSDVISGANSIGGMFSSPSLGVAGVNIGGSIGGTNAGSGDIFNFTINAAPGQSEESIADYVISKINTQLRSRGSVWR